MDERDKKREKMKTIYPRVGYIIGCYLHQDWNNYSSSIVTVISAAAIDRDPIPDDENNPIDTTSLQHLHSELYDIVHRKTPKEQKDIFDALDPDLYLETEGAIELFFHSLLCITQNHLRSLNIPIPDNPPLHTEKDTSDE